MSTGYNDAMNKIALFESVQRRQRARKIVRSRPFLKKYLFD
jgi:hypothetical protein